MRLSEGEMSLKSNMNNTSFNTEEVKLKLLRSLLFWDFSLLKLMKIEKD